ncbi:type I restriction-modification system subunit M [Fundicoccus culcitae]|uniref:site-specific DNA-methyltransferase (adenine-specific) n=1 Tax=Fundicoccus culcitae TaxID=2969821 RepID=A0ABY5P7K9_9LACT|nr:type I restriction-modification system subunit M [Fundicoccus culcitae]UUX34721.1 type I restriction-modification system subunit M [Fundicoccus culcitae]
MAEKKVTGTKDLFQVLWNSANILRSKMDANEYKNYTLGLIFYKFLSDNQLVHVANLLEEPYTNLSEAQKIYEEAYNDVDLREELYENLQYDYSYTIAPELTFQSLLNDIHKGQFQREKLMQGFRDVETSDETFFGLFSDIDLDSNRLGTTQQKKSDTIASVMKELDGLNLAETSSDVLGDAYEYLISQFASESGKKAGEFYTPQSVSQLITRISMLGKENVAGFTVYDPTMGSGSLLLNAQTYSNEPTKIRYFGQELNTSTYNLARMNMMLHQVPVTNFKLRNADTLDQDWPTDEPTNFDAVLMNPPYSAKWSAAKGFLDDPRFSPYGVLAPKSKADFAFLLHGFYHLKNDGVMGIVLPHGILFRGGAEGKIRQILLESGYIDTVIGLPANLFYSTSIPTTVVILKKNKPDKTVFFIDASNDFEKVKTQNNLTDAHIDKIIEAYINKKDIDKYAHLADFDEIKENDFNLNIPRYIDTYEEEEPINIVQVSKEIQEIDKQIADAEKELLAMLDQLQVTDETKSIIEATKAVFRHD